MSFHPLISIKKWAFTALILLVSTFAGVGCQPATNQNTNGEHDHASDHDHEHEHGHEHDHEHGDDHGSRLPNDGAVVRIISPANRTTFASGEDIVVEIEVENFDLNDGGNHWHLYVDGKVLSMVAGG